MVQFNFTKKVLAILIKINLLICKFKEIIRNFPFGENGLWVEMMIIMRLKLVKYWIMMIKKIKIDFKRIQLSFIKEHIKIETYSVFVIKFMMIKSLLLSKIIITINDHIFLFLEFQYK